VALSHLGCGRLRPDGTFYGINRAFKLSKDTVARGVRYASPLDS
jgi:hypothetical protein